MNTEFSALINGLPGLLEQLIGSPLIDPASDLASLPRMGVYVFYERGEPIYVGRSNRLRERVREHGRPSGTSYDATFAFKLAKAEAEKSMVNVNMPRRQLEKGPVFSAVYLRQKDRVSHMPVRTVQISHPVLQSLSRYMLQ